MNIIPASPRRRWPAPHQLTVFMFIALASATSCGAPGGKQTESKVQVGVQTRDTTAEGDEIKRIIGTYAKSIYEANTALASQIWWDSPDVSFIHPQGHEHGFEQIKQNVYKHLMGDTFSERKLTIHDISVHVYEDAAWAEFYWDFVAKFRKDGSPVMTHGRETQVYRKAPDGWRLVHVHYSGMPVTEERKGF